MFHADEKLSVDVCFVHGTGMCLFHSSRTFVQSAIWDDSFVIEIVVKL